MVMTSFTINGLEVGVSGSYAVTQDTLAAVKSGISRTPVMVDRPGTYPALVRSQIEARNLAIGVIILGNTIPLRRTRYETLLAACGTGYPAVPISYTEDGDTFTFLAHCSGPVVDDWFERAAIEAIAPNPVATVT